ncbi:diguanylate cyclase domain-containing protein [Catenovulum agarivorans]|nr:diguanylate cyclase [Catenovulum agarivorans]
MNNLAQHSANKQLGQVLSITTHNSEMQAVDIEFESKFTLLLVHPDIEKLIEWKQQFEPQVEVELAQDGYTALQKTLQQNIDFVVCCANILVICGLNLCYALQRNLNSTTVPVMLVSNQPHEQEEAEVLKAGALDYVSSNISNQVLFHRVNNHMEVFKRNKQLEKVSVTDALTGLANRKYLLEQLESALDKANRGGYSLTFMMIDIDDFKKFNDAYGHLNGDKCLLKVARTLTKVQKRTCDLAARYGGEEFAVLLPFTDQNGANRMAELLRQQVENLAIAHADNASHNHVSVSVGVVTYLAGHATRITNYEQIIQTADENLYAAKSDGRNTVQSTTIGE